VRRRGRVRSSCNEGSFGNAYSGPGGYEGRGPLRIPAYELHKGAKPYGDERWVSLVPAGGVCIVDEKAVKVGVQYMVCPLTTSNVILRD